MVLEVLRKRNDLEEFLADKIKQMDVQQARIALELEKLQGVDKKLRELDAKLKELEKIVSAEGFTLQNRARSSKTKEAIRLILQKYGELTSVQLAKLIKLSRTRCNEYLKEMEEEGITTSFVKSRKKYYKLRQ